MGVEKLAIREAHEIRAKQIADRDEKILAATGYDEDGRTTIEIAESVRMSARVPLVHSALIRMQGRGLVKRLPDRKGTFPVRSSAVWRRIEGAVAKPRLAEAWRLERAAAREEALAYLVKVGREVRAEDVERDLGRSRSFARTVLGELVDAGLVATREVRRGAIRCLMFRAAESAPGVGVVAARSLSPVKNTAKAPTCCGVRHKAGVRCFVRAGSEAAE